MDSRIEINYNAVGLTDECFSGNTFPDNECCAKSIKIGRFVTYKVKIDNNGHLYDPVKKDRSYNLSAKNKINGDALFKFREVNENCFNAYVNYLKNKQTNVLVQAQREI